MYGSFLRLNMLVYINDRGYDMQPFVMTALVVVLVILWLRKYSLSRLLFCAIFGVYLLFLLNIAFFPLYIAGGYADAHRELPFLTNINLNPFYFGRFGTFTDAFPGLALNILLTIPFGFGVSFIASVRLKQMYWIAPAVGLAIEGAQLLISLLIGYTYRQIDINDVLMNALGVLIGYALFLAFAWLYVFATQRLRIYRFGLTTYIYDVATRAIGLRTTAAPLHSL